METAHTPRNTAADLKARIASLAATLAAETDAARQSETFVNYLNFCARFHRYSPGNQILIMLQNPNASHVAGYGAWLKMHRFVRKGEHGIAILAPCIAHKPKKDQQQPQQDQQPQDVHFFRVVYIFDVSQTDGEPLPEPPQWKSPEQNPELAEKLYTFARSQGIAVKIAACTGNTQGFATSKNEIQIAPTAGTKTIVHEIAHILLGHTSPKNTDSSTIHETEAEAVAYIVSKELGIGNLASPNYIALHGADSKLINARLTDITAVASKILNAIMPQQAAETDD